ncbi:hypothetical protein PILCRDRAFT_815772 [Piloderma croceum F 1598]|uniref:Uncharacterized protein n=1 Tax=Piloderma croceum (strain F 1598) TaxID=765440 RepID=A0A0C3G778_PILCF|nr:hypothetical protein PILCRDRAFT_815772 [Piloderma croceum F 1598]
MSSRILSISRINVPGSRRESSNGSFSSALTYAKMLVSIHDALREIALYSAEVNME